MMLSSYHFPQMTIATIAAMTTIAATVPPTIPPIEPPTGRAFKNKM